MTRKLVLVFSILAAAFVTFDHGTAEAGRCRRARWNRHCCADYYAESYYGANCYGGGYYGADYNAGPYYGGASYCATDNGYYW